MKRYANWLLSLCLHLLVLAVLVRSVRLAPVERPEPLLEVDLTRVEEPAEVVVAPPPAPKPPPPAPVCEPSPTPPEPAEAAPLPMDKTLVLADKPPASPAPAAPEPPEPAPAPEVEEISPVKTPTPPAPAPKPGKGDADEGDRIDVRKGDFIVHRGHEARFGRTMMADYFSYSPSEFSGRFTTRDDRIITIIDARKTKYGRFLIYDSKNKTLRRLKEFSKYVYTIGPSLDADKPVVGVVTFLAKNDRIERFVLTTDDDRLAHYPRKVHVREDDVTFAAPGGKLRGSTTLPPETAGRAGVVFLPGACVDPGLIRGVTRSLAERGVASLFFEVRGCDGEKGDPADRSVLAADARAGLRFLSDTPRLEGGRVGLWGNGPGALVALAAAERGDGRPDFLVCLLNDGVKPAAMPGADRLRGLDMPVLWIVTGRGTSAWRPYVAVLERLRDREKRRFTIVIAPRAGSREINAAAADLSAWMEQVAEDHARLAAGWIGSLK